MKYLSCDFDKTLEDILINEYQWGLDIGSFSPGNNSLSYLTRWSKVRILIMSL